jgi:hypothetical protein
MHRRMTPWSNRPAAPSVSPDLFLHTMLVASTPCAVSSNRRPTSNTVDVIVRPGPLTNIYPRQPTRKHSLAPVDPCKPSKCGILGSISGCVALGDTEFSCGNCRTGYTGELCTSCAEGFTTLFGSTRTACICGKDRYVRDGACVPCGKGATSPGANALACSECVRMFGLGNVESEKS